MAPNDPFTKLNDTFTGNITELRNLTLRSLSTLSSALSRTGEYNWVRKYYFTFFIDNVYNSINNNSSIAYLSWYKTFGVVN